MFKTTRNAFYIGRGGDYYASLEAALKLKEISYVQAEGFAAGELKHGTIALIEKDTPVVAIISDPVTAARTRSNAVKCRRAEPRYYTLPWRAKPKKVTRLSSTKLIRFWRHWLRSSQHNCWLTSRVPIVGMTLTVPATWLSRLLLNRSKLIMA